MDDSSRRHEVSNNGDSGEDTRELLDSIEEFPTTGQPVLDTVMKDMLMSLRSSLQADMMEFMRRFNKKLNKVESRVEHIETKMGEVATTINDLVDASEDKDEEMDWVKMKLADMEDRKRRNNLKLEMYLNLFNSRPPLL